MVFIKKQGVSDYTHSRTVGHFDVYFVILAKVNTCVLVSTMQQPPYGFLQQRIWA